MKATSGENDQRQRGVLHLAPVHAFAELLVLPERRGFIRPTPTIEPISVCEEEAGRPRYQVPTFQMIAERSEREHRGEAGARCGVENELDRQEHQDAEGDCPGRGEYAEKVPHA